MTPEALARACAAEMAANDRATAALGIEIVEVGPGRARLSLLVRDAMLNGHAMCHGGVIFTLADTAFAFACNTTGDVSVASQCSIAFLRPALLGETLEAVAEERQREGRQGIYDVRVSSGAGVVAEFRGLSRTTGARFSLDHAA